MICELWGNTYHTEIGAGPIHQIKISNIKLKYQTLN